jgi:hypothetical protein
MLMGIEELDTGVPHSARIYDYLLGGKDNFKADRDAAAEIVRNLPSTPVSMRANRNFMVRVGRYLAAERGLSQFLDIGTGLPTSPNLHEVVQSVNPGARIVYADNDQIVLIHARALLTSTPEGKTAYLDADLCDPESILGAPQLRDTLDLDRPVALSLIAILQFLPAEQVRPILSALMAPLPSGSVLALSVPTTDVSPTTVMGAVMAYRAHGINLNVYSRDEVEALFDGLELLDPGVALVHHWHPDDEARRVPDGGAHMYGAVGVKP